MYLMNSVFMLELDKIVVVFINDIFYIRGVWNNLKNTSELYFNGYKSTSCTPSSTSASSGSRRYHSWVTWFHLKESRWTLVGLEAANVYVRDTKFPWVGWILSTILSELLQDHKANY
jgi:hypothetical protein